MKIEIDIEKRIISVVDDGYTFEEIIHSLERIFPDGSWKTFKLENKHTLLNQKIIDIPSPPYYNPNPVILPYIHHHTSPPFDPTFTTITCLK